MYDKCSGCLSWSVCVCEKEKETERKREKKERRKNRRGQVPPISALRHFLFAMPCAAARGGRGDGKLYYALFRNHTLQLAMDTADVISNFFFSIYIFSIFCDLCLEKFGLIACLRGNFIFTATSAFKASFESAYRGKHDTALRHHTPSRDPPVCGDA